jgi:hypothetical protein
MQSEERKIRAMHVRGKVVRRRFGEDSKSDHMAVWLETDGGDEFVLQRIGGNPFADASLDALVGKRIEGNGTKRGYSFYLTKWREL